MTAGSPDRRERVQELGLSFCPMLAAMLGEVVLALDASLSPTRATT